MLPLKSLIKDIVFCKARECTKTIETVKCFQKLRNTKQCFSASSINQRYSGTRAIPFPEAVLSCTCVAKRVFTKTPWTSPRYCSKQRSSARVVAPTFSYNQLYNNISMFSEYTNQCTRVVYFGAYQK